MPFDADKNEQKRAAREMINMVMAMNQTRLKQTPIDCFHLPSVSESSADAAPLRR
jgi:hypothetical protein